MGTASYDGTPFVWVRDSGEVAQNGSAAAYPFSASAFGYDETGAAPTARTFEGYVDGAFAYSALDALIASVRAGGRKTLVHPLSGAIDTVLPKLSWNSATDELGRVSFSLSVTVCPPGALAGVVGAIGQAAAAADAALNADFEALFAPLIGGAAVLADAKSALAQTLDNLTTLPAVGNDALAAKARLQGIANTLHGAGTTALDYGVLISTIDDLLASVPFLDLLRTESSESAPVDSSASEQQQTIARNRDACQMLQQHKCSIAAARAVLAESFATAGDAIVARVGLTRRLTRDITRQRVSAAQYGALRSLRVAVAASLDNIVLTLPQEKTAQIEVPTLSVVAAYALTGDAEYDIDARNNTAGVLFGTVRYT